MPNALPIDRPPPPSFGFSRRAGAAFAGWLDTGQAHVIHRGDVKIDSITELRRHLRAPLKLEEVSPEQFDQRLQQLYAQSGETSKAAAADMDQSFDLRALADELPEPTDLMESADDAPIIRLLNALMGEAIKENASDIHIEPFENRVVVRFRVDGMLKEVLAPQKGIAAPLASRIKIMAKLDIAERRLPQDGRISLKVAGRAVDVRVSTIPSGHGERIVLRLLDKQAGRLDLRELGMPAETLQRMEELIYRPHGILLVTGPTGSGKTTTLYGSLLRLNDSTRNILTVEDPIEYYIDGIGQTQVNTKVDMSFARGLRAILRQDPDVVMVGEIRDLETAQIAIQASLTGHLVLSTLHTNSAVGAVTRLRDMGVEPFLLSSSLLGVLAQRLVRVLDPATREAYVASTSELRQLGVLNEQITAAPGIEPGPMLYRPNAAAAARRGGYRGRTGIYELVSLDEKMRQLVHSSASEAELEAHVRQSSPSIFSDGVRKALAGVTSIDEILKVTRED
jgi:general secretion pathway protein E